MKKTVLFAFVISATFFSCTKTEVNPDNGAAIAGKYQMNTYTTQSGPSTGLTGNYLVVTRVDNNKVKVVIDYAAPTANDVELSGMAITKSGSDYRLSQTFSNANATGNITGSTFTFGMAYTKTGNGITAGDYVNITAVK